MNRTWTYQTLNEAVTPPFVASELRPNMRGLLLLMAYVWTHNGVIHVHVGAKNGSRGFVGAYDQGRILSLMLFITRWSFK